MVASVVLHFNEICWDMVLGHGHDDGIIADRKATLIMQIKARFLESEKRDVQFYSHCMNKTMPTYAERLNHFMSGNSRKVLTLSLIHI